MKIRGWGLDRRKNDTTAAIKEYIQFLLIARGSPMELLSHFAVAHKLECVQQADLDGIETGIEDIGKIPTD